MVCRSVLIVYIHDVIYLVHYVCFIYIEVNFLKCSVYIYLFILFIFMNAAHCFIQQENTFNAACTIGTFKTYPMQHYMICKMLKKSNTHT